MGYFSKDEYERNLISFKIKAEDKDKILAQAYKKANECRNFEIELFWQRGTYFWAFIIASFTVHFGLLTKVSGNEISLKRLMELPGFSLFGLAITALFCFFFSFLWVFVHKGSKFWQKNWEMHIDCLERSVTGELFNIVMNSNNLEKCSNCLFSLKPYRYSVSKISHISAIVLTITSFFMFVFYICLMFTKLTELEKILAYKEKMYVVVPLALIVLLLLLILLVPRLFDSSPKKNIKERIRERRCDWCK